MPAGVVVERGGGPLEGVVVSDGLLVTRSGPDGSFALPERADAEFVFATVPSAHRALEPGWFVRVRAGDSGAITLELARRSEAVTDRCTFVQVTDLHVSVDEGARLRPMIEAGVVAPPGVDVTGDVTAAELREDLELVVERVQPDFIAATGDLADYGQLEEMQAYRDAITGLGVPVASVPGNHDHLSVLCREAIDGFFSSWRQEDDPELSPGDAFQKHVFGGDWRRPGSGRAPWRDVIGPLYYSFDWGGVHFVAYDGEGLRRYGDDYPQDEWLANDLAALDAGTPVVVLTHFPESEDFYRTRFGTVRLLASLSGHWHGARVWHDGDAHHWTSSTLGFGGIDFTPRGYRVVEVDRGGARSWWRTVEAPSDHEHLVTGAVAVHDGTVIVATERPDVTGAIQALGSWSHELASAARAGVIVDGGTVYAQDVTGQLCALDAATGETRWVLAPDDPCDRWSLTAPVVHEGRLLVGSARGVRAYDARDAREIWAAALASVDWAASWSGVAAGGDTVVIGAANDDLHLAALDASTGTVRWLHKGRDIAGTSVTPVITGDAVLVARAPGWLASYALVDGQVRWQVPLDDAWPVALAVQDDLAVVRSATGTVSAHDVVDGATRWSSALGPGDRAARPYSRRPGGTRVPLVIVRDRVWTAAGTEVLALELASGARSVSVPVGTEVAAVVLAAAELVAVAADGQVVRTPV